MFWRRAKNLIKDNLLSISAMEKNKEKKPTIVEFKHKNV